MEKIKLISDNYEKILEIALISNSKADLCQKLGWAYGSHRINKLEKVLNELNFDKKIFLDNRQKNNKCIFNDKDKLEKIVKSSFSVSDVIRGFKVKNGSANFELVRKYIKIFDIDISHFDSNKRFLKPNYKGRLSNEELFIVSENIHVKVVRNRVIKEGLLEYKCVGCGNTGEWLGEEITLQLDHINGNRKDNRLKNLRFLCPNCHCLTPTWGNKRGSYNKQENRSSKLFGLFEEKKHEFLENELKKCETINDILKYFEVTNRGSNYKEIKRILKLNKENPNVIDFLEKVDKKIVFPEVTEVLERLKKSNFSKLSKEIGCSDNSLRNYLTRNGIDIKKLKN